MEAHRASYNSRKNAICPGVYAVVTNGIRAADVRRNAFILEVFMLEAEVQVIDAVISFSHENDPVSDDWCRIKTALAELGTTPNTTQAKIAELSEAYTEWQGTPDRFPSDRLLNAIGELTDNS